MIHHLARAFLVRDAALQRAAASRDNPASDAQTPSPAPSAKPVKARPITPWSAPVRPVPQGVSTSIGHQPGAATLRPAHGGGGHAGASRRVRISTDPSDARRTVIAGRFAEVCAALDRLVREQEAAV